MWHPFQAIPVGWWRGLSYVVLLILTLLIGSKTNVALKPRMLLLELAGTKSKADRIINKWREDGALDNALTLQKWDDYFLIFYSVALSLACIIVTDAMFSPASSGYAWGLMFSWAALVAGVLDFIENRAINRMLSGVVENPWPQLSFVCAALKFLILAACFIYVLSGLVARFSLLKPVASSSP
jgi:branched-subunit amino acid transport protein